MPSECDINFDHPNGVYYSGEYLNGSVELRTTSSKSIRGVKITINGYAKVRWTERRTRTRNGKTEHYTVTYSAHDQYLNSVTFVIGADGGPSFDLAPGTYNHTFTCVLPPGLPTSCQGEYGEIKYEVIVTADRPYMFDNVFKQGFTVIQPLNLNLDPSLKLPKKGEDLATYCCFCCCGNNGKGFAELSIPFGGYAPGQKIEFRMLVANDTNSDVEARGVKVKLEKRITFEARTPSHKIRHTERELASKYFGPVLRLTRKEFKDFIQIPSVPSSSNNPAQCIRFDYFLTGRVETGCCSSNIRVVIPITIGTVPIVESATNPANIISLQPRSPTAPTIGQSNGIDLPPSYMSVAPPSYEDSLSIGGKFEDDERDENHKEKPFTPKYPVYYNFAGAPSAPPEYDTSPANSSTSNYGWSSQQP